MPDSLLCAHCSNVRECVPLLCVCVLVCVCVCKSIAQCEINLNCNHNCHSIHCILLLLLLYSYVMCCVWMNCRDWLLDAAADAVQWSSLKATIKTTVLSLTCFIFILPFSLSLFNAFPRWHSRSVFFSLFFILKSLNVCSTFLSTWTIKNTSSRSQLFFVQHIFYVQRCSGTNTHTQSSHTSASMRMLFVKTTMLLQSIKNETKPDFHSFTLHRILCNSSAKVNSCMYALKFGHYHFHSRCDFCDSDSHFHAVRKSNFSSVYFPSRISCYLDFDTRLCWFPKTEHTIIIWFAIERFVLSNFVHLIEHIWWTSRTFVQNMLFANCPIGYNFSHFSSFLSHSHSLSFIRSFIHSDLMC